MGLFRRRLLAVPRFPTELHLSSSSRFWSFTVHLLSCLYIFALMAVKCFFAPPLFCRSLPCLPALPCPLLHFPFWGWPFQLLSFSGRVHIALGFSSLSRHLTAPSLTPHRTRRGTERAAPHYLSRLVRPLAVIAGVTTDQFLLPIAHAMSAAVHLD